MAAPSQVVGQARIKVNGDLLETDGSATLEIGGIKRESVTGDYQADGFRESTEPSKLEVSVLVKGRTNLGAFRDIVGATITVEYDTGQTWLIRNGYTSEPPSIGQSDGKAKLIFMGAPAEEVN
jgi:Phage tail tube protein